MYCNFFQCSDVFSKYFFMSVPASWTASGASNKNNVEFPCRQNTWMEFDVSLAQLRKRTNSYRSEDLEVSRGESNSSSRCRASRPSISRATSSEAPGARLSRMPSLRPPAPPAPFGFRLRIISNGTISGATIHEGHLTQRTSPLKETVITFFDRLI